MKSYKWLINARHPNGRIVDEGTLITHEAMREIYSEEKIEELVKNGAVKELFPEAVDPHNVKAMTRQWGALNPMDVTEKRNVCMEVEVTEVRPWQTEVLNEIATLIAILRNKTRWEKLQEKMHRAESVEWTRKATAGPQLRESIKEADKLRKEYGEVIAELQRLRKEIDAKDDGIKNLEQEIIKAMAAKRKVEADLAATKHLFDNECEIRNRSDRILDETRRNLMGDELGSVTEYALKLKEAVVEIRKTCGIDHKTSVENIVAAVKKMRESLYTEVKITSGPGWTAELAAPIKVTVNCPRCGKRHVDKPPWDKINHRKHRCEHCGREWRVADVATVAVDQLESELTPYDEEEDDETKDEEDDE